MSSTIDSRVGYAIPGLITPGIAAGAGGAPATGGGSTALESRVGYIGVGRFAFGYADGQSGVAAAPVVSSLTVSPTSVTLNRAGFQQFAYSITVSNGGQTGVTWSVVSGPGSIDRWGFYSGPSDGTQDATITVRATSAQDSTVHADATVTFHPKAYLGAFFTVGDTVDGTGEHYLCIVESDDAVNWTRLPLVTQLWLRDPSLLKVGSTYYVASTKSANGFYIYSSTDLLTWSLYRNVTFTLGTFTFSVAPEWFVDYDGSVHVVLAASTTATGISPGDHFQIYETHPTLGDWSTWSAPVKIYGSSTDLFIDPCVVRRDGAYTLVLKNQNTFSQPVIQFATSSSLTSGYGSLSTIFSTAPYYLWEGPDAVLLADGWHLFVDHYDDDTAHHGRIYYLLSTNDWVSWTSPALINTQGDLKHGSVLWPTAPQTIVGSIPPNRSWPNPTINGPQTIIGSIPSQQSWATPVMQVPLAITVTGIPSQQAWPSPTLSFVLALRPSPIPSHQSWPSPAVSSGAQYIAVLPGIPSQQSWPSPAVDGGTLATRIYIGGTDRTAYLSWSRSTTVESQTLGRWKLQFVLDVKTGVASYRPQVGQTVLVVDHGYRLFAGCISEVKTDRAMMTANQVHYYCTASDKSAICDRRVVPGTKFSAGDDVATAIRNIVTNYLDGEGITTGGVPADGSLGAFAADLPLNFSTVTRAFDSIAQQTGTVWWVDVGGVLHLSALTFLARAPFNLSETSRNWRQAPGYLGLTVTQTTTDYYNRLYAVSNLTIVPGAGAGGTGAGGGITETFVFGPGNAGIRTAPGPGGVGTVAVGIITSAPIGAISSLAVDGAPQTTVDFGSYSGQTPNPPDLLWFFPGPATGAPAPGASPVVLPIDGATISVTYVPYIATSSSLAQYGTALSPITSDPLGTCGSGVYEGVVQVDNISSQDDLNAIAAAELSRIGGIPTIVEYETDVPGLAPGQLQNINIPLSGAANIDVMITEVSGVFVPPNLADGGAFRWRVTARSNQDPGNWIKWYERLIGRTQAPLPVLQSEDATFILGAGSSLSGGVASVNPYIVKRTGLLVELGVAAGTPPVGQNLLLELIVNGITVATVTLPDSAAPNQLVLNAIPRASSLYIFAQSVVTTRASYVVTTGGTVTRAANVTFYGRWAV